MRVKLITIGSSPKCDIVLSENGIKAVHCQLIEEYTDPRSTRIDSGMYYYHLVALADDIRVNGKMVKGEICVNRNDHIHIGDYSVYCRDLFHSSCTCDKICYLILMDDKKIFLDSFVFGDCIHRKRVSPDWINKLEENEIFVFGSNLAGQNGGGAARIAFDKFGAVWGQGVGLQGQSYAIPTIQGGVETIKPYVDDFVVFAEAHPALKFFVTEIGCGIAGFTVEQIAPLFRQALRLNNVYLPASFIKVLN